MQVGTYTVDGRPLNYDELIGTFDVGGRVLLPSRVRELSYGGQVNWPNEETRAWFETSFPIMAPDAPGVVPTETKKSNGCFIAVIIVVVFLAIVFMCGILTAIAIPVFNSAKANAQRKSCYANERTIEAAAQTFRVEGGSLPESIEALVPTYLKQEPVCPSGGTLTWDQIGGLVTCSVHGRFE